MRFIRRLKRTTRQYITVAFICIAIIGTAAVATSVVMIGQIRQEYEYMLSKARQEMDENKKNVLVALSDIKTGEILTADKVEKKIVYSSQPDESYITTDDLGKPVIIDIPQGTHIVKSMMAQDDVSPVLREVEYDVIQVSSNIEANDFVDVRIFYPNGETFVVLSKKQLKGYQPDMPVCYLWVDEEEILRMSAAIVDAALYSGSKLYMTKYIEPNIQQASLITYTPSISVLNLIENDPNIVERCSQLLNIEVRKALENRLSESMVQDVGNIRWDIDGEIRYMPVTATDSGTQGSNYDNNQDYKDGNAADTKALNKNEAQNKGEGASEFKMNYLTDIESETDSKNETDIEAKTNAENGNLDCTEFDMSNDAELGQIYDINYFISTEG